MWKCKKCGETESYIVGLNMYGNNVGYSTASFDKNGEFISYVDDMRVYKSYSYCQCENCNLTGDTINEIAEWVEE